LRRFLNVASVADFLMSGGSSFQSRGAATLNARSPLHTDMNIIPSENQISRSDL